MGEQGCCSHVVGIVGLILKGTLDPGCEGSSSQFNSESTSISVHVLPYRYHLLSGLPAKSVPLPHPLCINTGPHELFLNYSYNILTHHSFPRLLLTPNQSSSTIMFLSKRNPIVLWFPRSSLASCFCLLLLPMHPKSHTHFPLLAMHVSSWPTPT